MPQKPTTLHNFFRKAEGPPMRNLTNLGNANSEAKTPVETPRGKTPVQNPKGTSRATPLSAKRKAADLEPEPRQAKQLKTSGEIATQDNSKKSKLQELLGGSSAKEQNFKAIQDRFNWLEAKRLCDAEGRRPNDKGYDERTIKVPEEIWQKLSASQRQYWEVKQRYRDVILFFKIGSFYELYEDDAQVGQDLLGWKLTLTGVGSCRQVGCPASGLNEALATLTAAGYKVGCMEQVETAAEAKAKRGPKAMIQRTLMRIHSPATATGAVSADAVTLLALFEVTGPAADWSRPSQSGTARFGFAFLDAAAGRYFVGTIVDDAGRANLSAMLTQVAPKEVIFARNELSSSTSKKLACPPTPLRLSPTDRLDFAQHVVHDGLQSLSAQQKKSLFGALQLPEGIGKMGFPTLAALAALVKHLRRLNADSELVTEAQMVVPYDLYEGALRMDGPTLQNLDLLETQDGGSRGSLLSYLDACASAGGRRLLKAWLCRPLRSIPSINARLDAVGELAAKPCLMKEISAKLGKITDLERLLGRVRNAVNPPGDAIPFALKKTAQARRLEALFSAVNGVSAAMEVLEHLGNPSDCEGAKSALLKSAVTAVPSASACETLQEIGGCLIEGAKAPKSAKKVKASKVAASSAQLTKQAVEKELSTLLESEDTEERQLTAEIQCTSRLIKLFLEQVAAWEALESAISTVDVLCSFANFSKRLDGPTCRPEFVDPGPNGEAVLDLTGLWHPCVFTGEAGPAAIPNDLKLGTSANPARSLLLTGPNMGGKSTILRAACCATIMAQMGCWIPAAKGILSPADRIFTRLGAQDRIIAGESTFLVECHETAAILQHATPASLVVLDELGRGTSTFDGYAIAKAVLEFLSSKLDCRLLFATHYHPLTTEFGSNPKVQLGHMTARLVDPCNVKGMPCIIFLYELKPGSCPKSYGLQVAQLAGIPESIRTVAEKQGLQMEDRLQAAFEGRKSGGLNAAEKASLRLAVSKLVPIPGV